jgi:hypothetical protein
MILVLINQGDNMKSKTSVLLLTLLSASSFAGDPDFINFAVNQAHKQGFKGCDSAIKKVYENAGGTDIRVNVTVDNSNPNFLSMVSSWGSKGDSVFNKTTFIKEGKKCHYDLTGVLHTTKSCLAYAKENSSFDYTAETGDYIWMKNKGGVLMLLHPAGSGCVATYSYDQES